MHAADLVPGKTVLGPDYLPMEFTSSDRAEEIFSFSGDDMYRVYLLTN